jgi:hypothetical protein
LIRPPPPEVDAHEGRLVSVKGAGNLERQIATAVDFRPS